MNGTPKGLLLESFEQPPKLSLTHIRWITEIAAADDENFVTRVPMFDVVGEQYRLESVSAAATAIIDEGTYQPAKFWIVPDDHNEHDAQAVAVYATASGRAYHVGFLSRAYAPIFRESMSSLGMAGQALEVLGCITSEKTTPHPNARLYLPVAFMEEVLSGYTEDPANHPDWLRDYTSVLKRPPSRRAKAFTEAELCKIYCLYAKRKLWRNFPDEVESRVAGYLASGIGSLGEVVPLYYDDHDGPEGTVSSPVPSDSLPQSVLPPCGEPTSQFEVPPELIAALRDFLRKPIVVGPVPWHQPLVSSGIDVCDILAIHTSVTMLELASNATLKDLFRSWDKWVAFVSANMQGSRLTKLKSFIWDRGISTFIERYETLLQDAYTDTEEKALEKKSEEAQSKLFQQLLARVKKATPSGKHASVDEALAAFEERCRSWIVDWL